MRSDKTFKYLTAIILYGTIGYFLHFVNASSEFVVLCRGLIGSSFILLFMFIKQEMPDKNAIKNNLLMLIISGVCLGLNWVFLFSGYRYAVSIASLLNYTAPIIVIIISSLFLKEKFTKKQLICIGLSFLGIILVSGLFDESVSVDIHCIIYGMLAAVCFVIVVLCNKRMHEIKPLDKTLIQLFMSFITVAPFVLINKTYPTSIDQQSLLILLMLGIVHTGFAYILYFGSIDSLPAHKIAVLGYIEPVLSIIIGVVIFNEPLSMLGGIGALLILGSALYSESRSK